ncbi:MAG: U32 family peptidase [Eubacterium sp.]|nr:U32 family peptidase [Eubacterium sp.]
MGNIKLDLGTNFDMKLLDCIEKVDKNHQIISMFGKLSSDKVGGGRASVALKEVSWDEIKKYSDRCKSMGIQLNYLINPLTLNNRDIIPEEHRELVDYIGEIHDIGVEWITVCSPYLLQLIKKQFPDMKVTIGVYAYMDSMTKIRNWIEMGADEITLMENCTRNFPFLRQLLKNYNSSPVRFRVIANNGCLHDCPFSLSHAGAVSCSSRTNNASAAQYYDYNLVNCYGRKIEKPTNMICSDWIRPEDLHYYEELCEETGNNNLVIKLVERTKSTEFLCRVAKAYCEESFDGNLLDLFNWVGNDSGGNRFNLQAYIEAAQKGDIEMESLIKYSAFFSLPNLYIDNKKLDGFMEHFVNNYNCRDKVCYLENESGEDVLGDKGNYCYYCHNWMKKAVSVEPGEQEKYKNWIENIYNLREKFHSSRFFNRG